jgi:uncharacterized repeat protein (TIGR03803 family)
VCLQNWGEIINPDGSNYTTLYAFGASASDGMSSLATLINVNGVLYGTTSSGGTNNNGTVFSIHLNGSNYGTLYSFGANAIDGIGPQAGLININGILYSTTANGGANNNGTVFSIYSDGSNYKILYAFGTNTTDGAMPFAALMNVNGVLYGSTTKGDE